MLGLIGDLASLLGPAIKQSLMQQFVEEIYLAVKNQPDLDSKELAKWAFT